MTRPIRHSRNSSLTTLVRLRSGSAKHDDAWVPSGHPPVALHWVRKCRV